MKNQFFSALLFVASILVSVSSCKKETILKAQYITEQSSDTPNNSAKRAADCLTDLGFIGIPEPTEWNCTANWNKASNADWQELEIIVIDSATNNVLLSQIIPIKNAGPGSFNFRFAPVTARVIGNAYSHPHKSGDVPCKTISGMFRR
jgi:hypothetical protein